MLRKVPRGRVCRVVMNRRVFLLTSAGSLLLATPVLAAASYEDDVARSLVGQGFAITSQRRTFLGRVRFTATRGETQREVVVDPSSGEILRDYSRQAEGARAELRAGNKEGGSSGEGSTSGGEGSSGGGGESPAGGENPSGGGSESPSGGGEPSKEPARERARERDGVRK